MITISILMIYKDISVRLSTNKEVNNGIVEPTAWLPPSVQNLATAEH